jgi:hypothetical protein
LLTKPDLSPKDRAGLRRVSRRFEPLARDNLIWKELCFGFSQRELHLERLARQGVPYATESRRERLVNWDPEYHGREPAVDWYSEYVQRVADINVDWLDPWDRQRQVAVPPVASGCLVFEPGEQVARKVIGVSENLTVAVWDISRSSSAGTVLDWTWLPKSDLALNSIHPSAIEAASLDEHAGKAYFAAGNYVLQVDLQTLQLTGKHPITDRGAIFALSSADPGLPLTVATERHVHLIDPRARVPTARAPADPLLIHDPAMSRSVKPFLRFRLVDPGPRSILHVPALPSAPLDSSSSIWVAGRFSHLLGFDRRRFPALARAPIPCAARNPSLALLPNVHCHIPPSTRSGGRGWSFGSSAPDPLLPAREIFSAKEKPGHTILAAGMHRGGAGLALHALGTAAATDDGDDASGAGGAMTAATTFRRAPGGGFARALAGAPHGARLVLADSAGWLRWVERDGATAVRAWNVNSGRASAGPAARLGRANGGAEGLRDGEGPGSVAQLVRLRPPADDDDDDFVTRILPVGRGGAAAAGADGAGLVLTTQEGRVGLLGFGAKTRWGAPVDRERTAEEEEARAGMEEQTLYERRMRWALAAHANEVNFFGARGGQF